MKRAESSDSTTKYGDSESDTSEYQTPRLSVSGESVLGVVIHQDGSLEDCSESTDNFDSGSSSGHQCAQGHNLLSFPGECAECNALSSEESVHGGDNLPCSDSIHIPGSGYLLANQVGCEAMMAVPGDRVEDGATGESLPDGDAREAMFLATATLSTLLSGNPVSPVNYVDTEDDSSAQSPLDSGLGTLNSGSDDTSSLSDRSPESQPCGLVKDQEGWADDEEVAEQHHVSSVELGLPDQWHVHSIPCSSVISSVKTGETSQSQDVATDSNDIDNLADARNAGSFHEDVVWQSWVSAQPGSSTLVHTSFFPVSVVPSKEYVQEDSDSLTSLEIPPSDTNCCDDVLSGSEPQRSEVPRPTCVPIRNLLQQVSSADQSDNGKIKLSVVRTGGGDGMGTDDEWLGLAQGEGQLAICSSNVGRENAEGSGLYEQYASNWDSLTLNQEPNQHNALAIVDPAVRSTWQR